MEVKLTLTSPQQLAQLIQFWHTSKIYTKIWKDTRYDTFLYQAIEGHFLNPTSVTNQTVLEDVLYLYTHLQNDCEDNPDSDSKEQLEIVANFLGVVENDSSRVFLSSDLQKPTDHLKMFCGPEWLTPKGLISQRSVLLFFDQQCKIRGIRQENGMIYLDDWSRKLFQISGDTLPRTALIEHVRSLLCSS